MVKNSFLNPQGRKEVDLGFKMKGVHRLCTDPVCALSVLFDGKKMKNPSENLGERKEPKFSITDGPEKGKNRSSLPQMNRGKEEPIFSAKRGYRRKERTDCSLLLYSLYSITFGKSIGFRECCQVCLNGLI